MRRKVRGEQPLPGNAERLLQAQSAAAAAVRRSFAEYLSVSVSVSKDGNVRVSKLTMDPHSGSIVPEYLDSFQATAGEPVDLAEIVRYWAYEVACEARGDRV